MIITRSLCAVAALLTCVQAPAADIAREVQNPGVGNGSFGEIGLSLATGKLPLVGFNDQSLEDSGDQIYSLHIDLEGRLEYKRAFVEAIEDSSSNLTFGFNAYTSPENSYDVILTSLFGDIDRSDIAGLETIQDRNADIYAGVRSSYYFGNSIAQLELVNDISGEHGGVVGTLQFGHQAQVRNWNFHTLFGLRYYSDNVMDHLFGVSSAESTDAISAYQAGDALMPSIQVGATLPLNEKWIFRASAEYSKLPSAVTDSPLAQGDSTYSLKGGVYYVIHGS